MFTSFCVPASSMQEHGKSCFLAQCVAINSARCVQHLSHQRVPLTASEAQLARLEEPEWATSDHWRETQRAHASGTCSFLHSFLQLFLFLWLLFSVLVTPSRHHLQMFAAIFFHRQTSKTIRILDQLLDGH